MKVSICIAFLMLVMITMQSPTDRSAPNSPIVQDVNWSDLEDIVSLENEHIASSPTHSTYQESTSTRQSLNELKIKQTNARRNERRKELLLEKKAKNAKAHQEFLKINREKARKKRSEMTKEQRIKFNERNRILQKSYRSNRKEKTGFTTKFYQQISEIKEQIKHNQATDEQLATLKKYRLWHQNARQKKKRKKN